MKLVNKKTGKIGYLYEHSLTQDIIIVYDVKGIAGKYASLAELNSEWEDCEEPAYYYFIQDDGRIGCDAIDPYNHKSKVEERKSIGNYFETREEAEKAVEKLKALKRLKDKGFRFMHNKVIGEYGNVSYRLNYPANAVEEKDLNLLFGGEE